MVADGQVDPVGVQRGSWISEHTANVKSVVFTGVEVRVITDEHWHKQLAVFSFEDSLGLEIFRELRAFSTEELLDRLSGFHSVGGSEFNELVEGRFAKHAVDELTEERSIEKARLLQDCQVNNLAADAGATLCQVRVFIVEDTEWNVFHRELVSCGQMLKIRLVLVGGGCFYH
jgi:hypothetical protein